MSNKVEVDNTFENLYPQRHFFLASVSTEQLLEKLKETHKRNVACIDFLRNKINKCEDILKSSVCNDLVIHDELVNYKHALFLLRYNDSLIEEQILDCKEVIAKNG